MMKGQGKEFWSLSFEGLGAQWLHSQSKAKEDLVAGDVCKGDDQGASGNLYVVETAKKQHGEDRAGVENESYESYRKSEVEEGFGFNDEV